MSKTIAIVYHSGYGHTAKVASSIEKGAKEGGANVSLHAIDAEGNLGDASWAALDAADAIVFGSPTYMGGPSWQFKKFADASSKRWFNQTWKNKLAAGFTNSGTMSGDKLSTLHYMFTLAMQQAMLWVGQSEQAPNLKGTAIVQGEDVNRIGSYSGLMTQANQDAPDITPPAGDHETARRFGKRIAEVVAKFSA